MFFPPADCERECKLVPGAELRVLNSIDGHLALFGADPNFLGQLDGHLKELLATD
jgi:homoserine O-acetyltransferase